VLAFVMLLLRSDEVDLRLLAIASGLWVAGLAIVAGEFSGVA
jgi:hypothetical protein